VPQRLERGLRLRALSTIAIGKNTQETPDSIGVSEPLKPSRAWCIVAGPELGPSALHCAAVPDGKDCQWQEGSFERIAAKNRAELRAHFAKLAKDCLTQPHHAPVNILGGTKIRESRKPCPELPSPIIDLSPPPEPGNKVVVGHNLPIPGNLSMPNFLRRIPKIPDIYSQLIPPLLGNTENLDFIDATIIPEYTTNASSVAFST
jgi:hypothetical protein